MKASVGKFLNYMTVERSVSSHTVAAYRNDVQQFIEFLEAQPGLEDRDSSYLQVDSNMIAKYILTMHDKAYSYKTRARKLSSIKSFFNFLVDEDIVKKNPVENFKSQRIGTSLPKFLSVEEVHKLLSAVGGSSDNAIRDRAMIELLYATGIRVTELISLNISDIELEDSFVRCFGKGSKERIVPIYLEAVLAIKEYLDKVRCKLVTRHSGESLFLNKRGRRLTRQGFWLILQKLSLTAGIDMKVTPHAIRHSFATHLLQGGAPLRHVQELLGHASVTTTQIYTHLTSEHVRAEYRKAHPRARHDLLAESGS